jgi:hypothetical protein
VAPNSRSSAEVAENADIPENDFSVNRFRSAFRNPQWAAA